MVHWRKISAVIFVLIAPHSAICKDFYFPPAAQPAILLGVKACVGAMVDPGGQAARLNGWNPVKFANLKTEGHTFEHDNVILSVQLGPKGGCNIVARSDKDFSRTIFTQSLTDLLGTQVPDKSRSLVTLPNGEVIAITFVSGNFVQLALAGAKEN